MRPAFNTALRHSPFPGLLPPRAGGSQEQGAPAAGDTPIRARFGSREDSEARNMFLRMRLAAERRSKHGEADEGSTRRRQSVHCNKSEEINPAAGFLRTRLSMGPPAVTPTGAVDSVRSSWRAN